MKAKYLKNLKAKKFEKKNHCPNYQFWSKVRPD